MLKRKAMSSLLEWKNKKGKKPLLVEGPRQVGKTFIIQAFASANYDACYELNFLKNSNLKSIFSGDLSANAILTGIRLSMPDIRFIPGHTLIFLDEIQACPEAVTALKFMGEDSRMDVIASGSSLGIVHAQTSSWPVGQVEYLDMWSLDFEEFLWALGIEEDLVDEIRAYRSGERTIPDAIHQSMMGYLHQYLVIGGMPEVVTAFLGGQNYAEADTVQRRIYKDYVADIAHYAEPEIRLKAQACWNSIPAQLSKENHKFQYSTVEKRGNAAKFGASIDWLTAARMVAKIPNVSLIKYPLRSMSMEDNFRMYPTDIGLLISAYDFSLKRAFIQENQEMDLSENIVFRTARGGIYEALAAEMLCKRGCFDRCWFYRNESGNLEIEFLIEGAQGIIPIEIKAGNNRSKSLDKVLQEDEIAFGYRFANQNAGISQKKITLPLYMLMFF